MFLATTLHLFVNLYKVDTFFYCSQIEALCQDLAATEERRCNPSEWREKYIQNVKS
jgi:hypothetical protein